MLQQFFFLGDTTNLIGFPIWHFEFQTSRYGATKFRYQSPTSNFCTKIVPKNCAWFILKCASNFTFMLHPFLRYGAPEVKYRLLHFEFLHNNGVIELYLICASLLPKIQSEVCGVGQWIDSPPFFIFNQKWCQWTVQDLCSIVLPILCFILPPFSRHEATTLGVSPSATIFCTKMLSMISARFVLKWASDFIFCTSPLPEIWTHKV